MMRRLTTFVCTASVALTCSVVGWTEECAESRPKLAASASAAHGSRPFTGRVTSNKVRMRLGPGLDSPVIREVNRGDLLAVTGEEVDGFLAVQAPEGIDGYVFRTLILDGVVEGNRVNVRLEPDLTAPVIGQLNNGDAVEGTICPESPKWLKIAPPETTRFYVSKDYLEHAGGPELIVQQRRRKQQVTEKLQRAHLVCQEQLKRHFPEIRFESVASAFQEITAHFADFKSAADEAQEALAAATEFYLQKKIAWLESRADAAAHGSCDGYNSSDEDCALYDRHLAALEDELNRELGLETTEVTTIETSTRHGRDFQPLAHATDPSQSRNSYWDTREMRLFESWKNSQELSDGELADFYAEEMLNCSYISGRLERFDRPVKNKPGDFLLVDPDTQRTLAYVYSTRVDLNAQLGHEVCLKVSQRPNNNFAFPAFYALACE